MLIEKYIIYLTTSVLFISCAKEEIIEKIEDSGCECNIASYCDEINFVPVKARGTLMGKEFFHEHALIPFYREDINYARIYFFADNLVGNECNGNLSIDPYQNNYIEVGVTLTKGVHHFGKYLNFVEVKKRVWGEEVDYIPNQLPSKCGRIVIDEITDSIVRGSILANKNNNNHFNGTFEARFCD